MALKRVAVEFGMGTDLHGQDYTKAAERGLRDALWHNSLNMADALGFPREAMIVHVKVGVPEPDQVDKARVAAILPYGTSEVETVQGGMEIEAPNGNVTVAASVAVKVFFDLETSS